MSIYIFRNVKCDNKGLIRFALTDSQELQLLDVELELVLNRVMVTIVYFHYDFAKSNVQFPFNSKTRLKPFLEKSTEVFSFLVLLILGS